MNNFKKIAVTGGAGFIGSELVRQLINNHEIEVLNIDKLTYAGSLSSLKELKFPELHSFLNCDICDLDKVKEAIFLFQPDALIHLAAESHVDNSLYDAAEFLNTNIIGTYKLLEVCREYFQSIKDERRDKFLFHHVSTDEVYGDLGFNKNLFSEISRYDPSSPYSASKAASDHLVRAWGRSFGIPYLITNCSNNYGMYQFPEKLIPNSIIRALNCKDIPIYGSGSQIRDWLYVSDHVEAILAVLENGQKGETFNIGGNNEMKNLEVVNLICNILDNCIQKKPGNIKKFNELIVFVSDRPGHDKRYAIDASKIHSKIGWKPKESFQSGLEKTVKWYIDNEWWWRPLIRT